MHAALLLAYRKRDPENAKLACDIADELIEQSAYIAALRVLRDLPGSSWDLPEVQNRVARCALATGSYQIAIEQLRALLAAGERDMCREHDLAYALLCAKQLDEAMVALRHATDYFGEIRELLILRARIHLSKGCQSEAIEATRAAILQDSSDATALGIQALAFLDGSCLAEAAGAARIAISIDPLQYEALLVESTLLLWAHDASRARELFERILIKNPRCGRTLLGCGHLAMREGDYKRAENFFLQSALIMPEHIGAWHALAWSQLLQGDMNAARSSFETAEELDRNFSDTHAGLAIIAMLDGEINKAERLTTLATRLAPNSTTACCARALLSHVRGDTIASQAKFSELLETLRVPAQVAPQEFVSRFIEMLGPFERTTL